MPTSARGSDRLRSGERGQGRVEAQPRAAGPSRPRGFTLIELLIVLVIVALASAVATLALRDPQASALEREADRLSALFEAARAEARFRTLGAISAASTPMMTSTTMSSISVKPRCRERRRTVKAAGERFMAGAVAGEVKLP